MMSHVHLKTGVHQIILDLTLNSLLLQPEPEFRPPMSEVGKALVMLVQRANMSRRTLGNDQGSSVRSNNSDDQDQ